MPELDTVLDDPAAGVQNGTGKAGDGGTDEGQQHQPFLGTFKTKEDAEKGFTDLQQQLQRFQSEADKTKAENTRLQSEVLEKLSQAVSQKQEGSTQDDIDAQLRAFAEEYDEKGDGQMLVDFVSGAMNATEERAYKKAKGELGAELESLKELVSGLSSKVLQNSPEFLEVKEQVDAISKIAPNVDRETAIKLAKVLKEASGPAQPAQPNRPGTTGGFGGGGDEGGGINWEEEEARLGVKISADQRKELTEKWGKQ